MATVYVYNESSNRVEQYELALSAPMPYIEGSSLTVREFKARSCSETLWTTKATMQAWNTTRQAFGAPIPVGYAFRRIWEGGHSKQSQHYAGTSFDAGQVLSSAERNRLWNTAKQTGAWSYVEPQNLTPTWVHFDKRSGTPACSSGGYPVLKNGARGVYVFVLQDALNALGYPTNGLDGMFGNGTQTGVRNFQRANGLSADGIVGCQTWQSLTAKALGIGQTSTVVAKCP